ncbi:MAG: OmpH family outer membrane protein [Selenomonadaceae bacterium]|nr:OmpH family outer membrane protein [Selenomonadaceae bacterium]
MKFIKKISAAALFAVSLMLTGCGQGQIASVDLNRVMDESPRVKTLLEEADGKMKDAQEKFNKDREANPNMSEEEAAKMQNDFQRKIAGINQGAASQIRSRIDVVLGEISHEKNLDVVVASSKDNPVLFQGGIDVTDDVIKKMQ